MVSAHGTQASKQQNTKCIHCQGTGKVLALLGLRPDYSFVADNVDMFASKLQLQGLLLTAGLAANTRGGASGSRHEVVDFRIPK